MSDGWLGERQPKPVKARKRWSRPSDDVLKINVDGAFINETGAAALGVIIRDKNGMPLVMACRTLIHCSDAEDVEALACLEGIRIGAIWPDRDFSLETDSALVF